MKNTRKSILRIGMIIYIIFGAQEAQIFAVFDTFEKSDENRESRSKSEIYQFLEPQAG